MAENRRVAMTQETVEYLAEVSKWLKTVPKAPKREETAFEEHWVGRVEVSWEHDDPEPLAIFRAEEDWWICEVSNG